MAAQCYACDTFGEPFAVGGRCVEIIHAVGYGSVDETVDRLLVNHVVTAVFVGFCRPAHAAISEYRHLFAGLWVCAVGHLAVGDRSRGRQPSGCFLSDCFTSGQGETCHGGSETDTFQEVATRTGTIIDIAVRVIHW